MPDIFVSPKKEVVKNTKSPALETLDDTSGGVKPIIEPKGSSLSAFISYPDNVHFDTQEEKEQIILFMRQHWITNIPWLLISLVLIFVPSFIFPFIISQGIFLALPAKFILAITLGWYLVAFGFTLVNFITWYFNVYIVTNERIIDVDFYQLLYKQMSSARLNKVQDITYKLGGVIRTIVDFGDVFIQTAGTDKNFDFVAVPHPEQVVRIISELTEKGEQSL